MNSQLKTTIILQDTKQMPIMKIWCMIKLREKSDKEFVTRLVFDPRVFLTK